MPQSLTEYAEWLDGRDHTWPVPPPVEPVKATPSARPLDGVAAVTWSVYGTLLRISDGRGSGSSGPRAGLKNLSGDFFTVKSL